MNWLPVAICVVYSALVMAVGMTGGDAYETNIVTAGVVSLALSLLLRKRHT